jgi:hypothetical protein
VKKVSKIDEPAAPKRRAPQPTARGGGARTELARVSELPPIRRDAKTRIERIPGPRPRPPNPEREVGGDRQQRIIEGARTRLARLRADEEAFARRRRELREAADARVQRQARAYMRLQEEKQKAFREGQRKRQAKIYAGAAGREKKRNGLNDLRKKFLGSDGELTPLMPPEPITNVSSESASPRVPTPMGRVAVSYDHTTESSIPPMRRSQLPVVGKTKTRIPMFKK